MVDGAEGQTTEDKEELLDCTRLNQKIIGKAWQGMFVSLAFGLLVWYDLESVELDNGSLQNYAAGYNKIITVLVLLLRVELLCYCCNQLACTAKLRTNITEERP